MLRCSVGYCDAIVVAAGNTRHSIGELRLSGRCVDDILEAISGQQDTAVQMIVSSIIRFHQHAASIKHNKANCTGRLRGGLTKKFMRWSIEMICPCDWFYLADNSTTVLMQLADEWP